MSSLFTVYPQHGDAYKANRREALKPAAQRAFDPHAAGQGIVLEKQLVQHLAGPHHRGMPNTQFVGQTVHLGTGGLNFRLNIFFRIRTFHAYHFSSILPILYGNSIWFDLIRRKLHLKSLHKSIVYRMNSSKEIFHSTYLQIFPHWENSSLSISYCPFL
ncbi:hypothetical protein D3C75_766140 [compost metagenome]